MAFSAQTIKCCELCEEDLTLDWRCIDCNKCLCDKCKNIHLKVTAKHQIVPIATPLQDVEREVIVDNIPCKTHMTKFVCLFCKTCDSLVCPDCVSAAHSKHDLHSLDTVLEEKLDKLRSFRRNIADRWEVSESKTKTILNFATKFKTDLFDSLSAIKEKEEELIFAIQTYSQSLQLKVEDQMSKVTLLISTTKQQYETSKIIFERNKRYLESILASKQGNDIFEATIDLPNVQTDSLPEMMEQFIPEKDLDYFYIDQLFGSFKKFPFPLLQSKIAFEVLKQYTTDFTAINRVISLGKKLAWICSPYDKTVKQVDISSNMKKLSEISLDVFDMALSCDNELVLSKCGSSKIKVITVSGKMKTLFSVAPLFPKGIHVTTNNHVVVGVTDGGDMFKPTEGIKRAVCVYSIDGKCKRIYQYDKKNTDLFTLPYRIKTNYNDILVIDNTSYISGRIVCLNKDDHLKWIYKGNGDFNPHGIVITSAGHVIISDGRTNSLHVLSENGVVLTYKPMSHIGIRFPLALDIDNSNQLWVGSDYDVKQTGAKIYIVKLIC